MALPPADDGLYADDMIVLSTEEWRPALKQRGLGVM